MKTLPQNYALTLIGLTAGLTLLASPISSQNIVSENQTHISATIMNHCPALACIKGGTPSNEQSGDLLRQRLELLGSASEKNLTAYEVFKKITDGANAEISQLVYLDFDAGGDPTFPVRLIGSDELFGTFNDHIYTVDERDTIQKALEEIYNGFSITFTQEEPATGPFTTIRINDNDSGNILINGENGGLSLTFGDAGIIDYFNSNMSDIASVDLSFWEFLAQDDPSGRDFEFFSGIQITTTLKDAISIAIINSTANLVAHELGHLLGLRHQDAFGAPGQGLDPAGPASNEFQPPFTGERNATETSLHIMASSDSSGQTFAQLANSRIFLSERSAVKLRMNAVPNVISETSLSQFPLGQQINFPEFTTPNTILQGVNKDKPVKARAGIISGSIDELDEVDNYSFTGQAGQIVNIEVLSFILNNRIANPVVSALTLYHADTNGNLTEVTKNFQYFRPFDPWIFDYTLPEDGLYIIEISAPDTIFINEPGSRLFNIPASLEALDGVPFRTGNYDAHIFIFDQSLNE